jgi:hypothetical protein
LTTYLAHHLRVMNTFFEIKINSQDHNTWTSNHPITT